MQYLTYLALIATVDAKWTPLKDLKKFQEQHPDPLADVVEWAADHKHPLKDAKKASKKWAKKEKKALKKYLKSLTKTEEEVELDRLSLPLLLKVSSRVLFTLRVSMISTTALLMPNTSSLMLKLPILTSKLEVLTKSSLV